MAKHVPPDPSERPVPGPKRLPSPSTKLARALRVGVFAALAAALGAMAWLRAELARDLERTASRQASALGPDMLGRAGEAVFPLAALNRTVARMEEDDPLSERLAVTKLAVWRPGEPASERVVAPYWAGGLDPREIVGPDARRVPIDLDNDPENLPDAFLYAAQSSARLTVATAWTAAAALGLVLALAALAWRNRRQQREIFTIALALAEKRRLLVRAERLALAGQVAANLLHDLRKPVNAIKALAEDALDEPESAAPADWERVRERAREFHGMLASARLERFVAAGDAETEWCDLRDIFERSINLLAHEQGEIQIQRDWRAETPLVEANPWELIQVFSNLLLNAYQALGGKGQVALRLSEAGGRLVAEVEDDGPGLAPEIRDSLFEPFATTRPSEGGSGLGAYIAREIVNSLGGTVEAVGPGPLGGARFLAAFPAERGAA